MTFCPRHGRDGRGATIAGLRCDCEDELSPLDRGALRAWLNRYPVQTCRGADFLPVDCRVCERCATAFEVAGLVHFLVTL